MATLTIELPSHEAQRAFNERRWAELLADRELARIEGRIETDRHGHIIMAPPPAARHGMLQAEIGYLLRNLMPHGPGWDPAAGGAGICAFGVDWGGTG